jgi:hypothetical protein
VKTKETTKQRRSGELFPNLHKILADKLSNSMHFVYQHFKKEILADSQLKLANSEVK